MKIQIAWLLEPAGDLEADGKFVAASSLDRLREELIDIYNLGSPLLAPANTSLERIVAKLEEDLDVTVGYVTDVELHES